jgi:hypothetical protein
MSNGRIDFYTKVHKALRADLFRLSQEAAAADYAEPQAVTALTGRLQGIVTRLSAHAAHEARFIHPLMAEKGVGQPFDAEHEGLESEQGRLAERLAEVNGSAARGLTFYRALNLFIARYLEHLEREERTMPVLWERCSDEELAAVMARFAASRPLEETLADAGWMLPCLSAPERAELVGSLTRTSAGPR